MYNRSYGNNLPFPIMQVLRNRANAVAEIKGSYDFPEINGMVRFYQTGDGVIVYADIHNLPADDLCGENVFGFHIHEGSSCTGNNDDAFFYSMSHYNPSGCPHPYHAGDMPPLFESNGRAVMIFLTNRFKVDDIIGRAVIIHDSVDDFTTQPSGNSGMKIACGIIEKNKR